MGFVQAGQAGAATGQTFPVDLVRSWQQVGPALAAETAGEELAGQALGRTLPAGVELGVVALLAYHAS